ncbi:MAG: arginine--tRNA ligase [Solirubrobacteraceae bacterium]|nr:arginine--tRNA ligase [Solirubrobacteraceae bacterium]
MPADPATDAALSIDARLRDAIAARASAAAGLEVDPATVALTLPKQAGHGDQATNIAMVLAKRAGKNPRELATQITEGLAEDLGDRLAKIEVAGPGFINLTFGDPLLREALAAVAGAGRAWGGGTAALTERVNVEFVSANPTGPMHIGHARNAAYGDATARLMAFHGHEVEREYYVNDFGSQVKNLGVSISARARGEEVPEGGYQGEYVTELAESIPGAAEQSVEELSALGVEAMLERARRTLDRFGVHFDRFFSERSLHEPAADGGPSALDRALEIVKGNGELIERDGAWWLQTEKRGDDKDRVVIRATGEPTYYASDLAYMRDKHDRGYDRQLLVLGADHHGYIGRMRAAFEAFGGDPEHLELLIMQLVNLVANGEPVKMSKRAGQFVTLDDLVDFVGVDAARWYLLQRSHDTAVELDVELARKESSENPVYYVQYAHARCCSVLDRVSSSARALADGLATDPAVLLGLAAPIEDAERALILRLGEFPTEVAVAADRRAPHRIATYALELSQTFTAFYRDCKIAGAEGDGVEAWRAALTLATRDTLATALELLGVSAPERMERRDEEPAAEAA